MYNLKNNFMTDHKKAAANKLLKRFDSQLKRLLMRDLVSIKKEKKQLINSYNAA